ncbi:MAG: pseudouridine synthase [Candidatus Heimdallarchaeota archaeon]|nr:pseudouridine synthase [Candidatus Heimdallarchaeota archaeon]
MSDRIDKVKPDNWTLRQLKSVAQYQFGNEFDNVLAPDTILVTFSKNTNKIREILLDDKRLATLRATDGLYSLGLEGARRIIHYTKSPKRRVIIQSDVSEFIANGRNVFAKHVVNVDPKILPEDEVVIVNEQDELLAVGRAQLSAEYMLAFQKGVAVKVRHGIKKLEEKELIE